MKLLSVTLFLAVCTSALRTTPQIFGVFRPDLSTNVEVAKLLPSDDLQPIPDGATKIRVRAHVGSAFEIDFKCIEKGKRLARSQDNKWIGCCGSGLKLKGDEIRGFDCCDEDEELTGCNREKGFQCCPEGRIYDGNACQVIVDGGPCDGPVPPCPVDQIRVNGHCVAPPCPEGEVLDNNECVCGPGTERSDDGLCETRCPPGSTLIDGSCRTQCAADQILINGHCVSPCLPGTTLKENKCVSICPNDLFWKDGECTCELPAVPIDDGMCGEAFCPLVCYEPPCPAGKYRDSSKQCVPFCPDGQHLEGNGICKSDEAEPCPAGFIRGAFGTCEPVCPTGEKLDVAKDECICQDGLERIAPTFSCVLQPQPSTQDSCPSGVQTGKCYTFTFENRQRFGYNSNSGFYTASEEDSSHQFGKFKFCTHHRECTSGIDLTPGMRFNIQEIQGSTRIWLSNAEDGKYIARTPNAWDSAEFVITRWPGGKHCLGGYETGVGLTTASESVGATILTTATQACIPMMLTEVPCDIRAPGTNCLTGNKTEASTSGPADGKVVSNANMPYDGSGVSGSSYL